MLAPAELNELAEKIADIVAQRMAAQPTLITKVQLAKRLSLSLATIDRLVARGEIPAVRVGARVLFSPTAVLKSLQSPAEEASSAQAIKPG